MRLRKDGGCGRGEGAVAAEGTKQPVRRCWGTGMDDGQGVAPRGPMRGKAIGGGRAEAKTPKPLRELGSAEAVIRQGGGFVLKEYGQAVGDGCIVCCGISGGEVGGQDAQQVVGTRGGARL